MLTEENSFGVPVVTMRAARHRRGAHPRSPIRPVQLGSALTDAEGGITVRPHQISPLALLTRQSGIFRAFPMLPRHIGRGHRSCAREYVLHGLWSPALALKREPPTAASRPGAVPDEVLLRRGMNRVQWDRRSAEKRLVQRVVDLGLIPRASLPK